MWILVSIYEVLLVKICILLLLYYPLPPPPQATLRKTWQENQAKEMQREQWREDTVRDLKLQQQQEANVRNEEHAEARVRSGRVGGGKVLLQPLTLSLNLNF